MRLDRELWMVGLVGWRRAQRVLMGFCIKVRSGNVQMFIQPTNQGKSQLESKLFFKCIANITLWSHRVSSHLKTEKYNAQQVLISHCWWDKMKQHIPIIVIFSWRLASLKNIFFFRVQVRIERQSNYLVVNMQLCKIDEQQFPLGGIGNWNGIWTME